MQYERIDESMIEDYAYFEENKGTLLCLICSNIVLNPVLCNSCNNLICRTCSESIEKALVDESESGDLAEEEVVRSESSPAQKSSRKSHVSITSLNKCQHTNIKEVTKQAKAVLEGLKLKCKYGCNVNLITYYSHLSLCEYNNLEVTCWNCQKAEVNQSTLKIKEEDYNRIRSRYQELMKENYQLKKKISINESENKKMQEKCSKHIETIRLQEETIKRHEEKLKYEITENEKQKQILNIRIQKRGDMIKLLEDKCERVNREKEYEIEELICEIRKLKDKVESVEKEKSEKFEKTNICSRDRDDIVQSSQTSHNSQTYSTNITHCVNDLDSLCEVKEVLSSIDRNNLFEIEEIEELQCVDNIERLEESDSKETKSEVKSKKKLVKPKKDKVSSMKDLVKVSQSLVLDEIPLKIDVPSKKINSKGKITRETGFKTGLKKKNLCEEVLKEINILRSNPKEYISKVLEMTQFILPNLDSKKPGGEYLFVKDKGPKITLNRGKPAFFEAIEVLNSAAPLPAFEEHEDLMIEIPDKEELTSSTIMDILLKKKEDIKSKFNNVYCHFDIGSSNPVVTTVLQVVDDSNFKLVRRSNLLSEALTYVGYGHTKIKTKHYFLFFFAN